jgi:signal transduction histidine kinase
LIRPRYALAAVAIIVAAVVAAAVCAVLLDLSTRHAVELAVLLALPGVVSFSLLAAGLNLFGRRARLMTRVAGAAVAGTVVALGSVAVASWRMFISTEHDLPLLLAVLAFAGFLSAVFAVAVTRGVLADLRRLRDATQRLSAGDLDARAEVPPGDELGDVASAFNTMADRLAAADRRRLELEHARRELTAAASHDLRTPLASLQAMIEAIEDGVATPAELPRYLNTMGKEVQHLRVLVDDLFELALLDAGALPLTPELTPLQALVLDTIEGMKVHANRRGIDVHLEAPEQDLHLWVDPARVQRVLINLIENAIEHTPSDGTVTVRVADEGDRARVEVADTGEGIESDLLPQVWERFFRADRSRTRTAGEQSHAGLGLAIARGFVEAHGGAVSVSSRRGSGSVFAFTLPKRRHGLVAG